MPLETGSYISDLVATNPVSADGIGAGDDHIRLIKSLVLATFPNVAGEVSADHYELDQFVPIGTICMFYSSTPPTNWAICNGQVVARTDGGGNITTPDLRNKFIVAAGATYAHDTTGGAATDAVTTDSNGAHTHTAAAGGDHDHGAATGGHSLTVAEMPEHSHQLQRNGGADGTGLVVADWTTGSNAIDSGPSGSGDAHSHTISASGTHTHSTDSQGAHTHTATVDTVPPYYALTYIMRY